MIPSSSIEYPGTRIFRAKSSNQVIEYLGRVFRAWISILKSNVLSFSDQNICKSVLIKKLIKIILTHAIRLNKSSSEALSCKFCK